MKKLLSINFIQYFVSSALSIVLPLLLLERKIDVATIGLIFGVFSILFFVARTAFAAIADQAGVRMFFVLNALASSGSIVVYYLANTPGVYALGKALEGVQASSFWSVVRTATFSDARGREEKDASILAGVRTLAMALGMLGAGAAIALWSFEGALFALFVLSLLLLPPALLLKKDRGRWGWKEAKRLVFKKRSAFFWKAAWALGFNGFAVNAVFVYVLPIFMKSKMNLGYQEIGAVFALYYLLNSLMTFFAVRARIPFSSACIASLVLLGLPMALLWNAQAFLPLFVLVALGDGLGTFVFESVVARASAGNSSVSTDIAVLHFPFRFFEFIALVGAGWVVDSFGYAPVFAAGAAAYALFLMLSFMLAREGRK